MNSATPRVFFKLNQSLQVALASDAPVLKEGRYGHYWIYKLVDDRLMFVPPPVQQQIQELGILEGQKFTITRVQERVNDRRTLRWLVAFPGDTPIADQALAEVAEPGDDRATPAAAPNACDEPATESLEAPTHTSANVQAQPEMPLSELPPADGDGNGNGHMNGAGKVNGKPPVELNVSPLLKSSLRAAIDAVIDAEKYAAARSYNVRFTSEDVRAAGISIFIAARDGGRR